MGKLHDEHIIRVLCAYVHAYKSKSKRDNNTLGVVSQPEIEMYDAKINIILQTLKRTQNKRVCCLRKINEHVCIKLVCMSATGAEVLSL